MGYPGCPSFESFTSRVRRRGRRGKKNVYVALTRYVAGRYSLQWLYDRSPGCKKTKDSSFPLIRVCPTIPASGFSFDLYFVTSFVFLSSRKNPLAFTHIVTFSTRCVIQWIKNEESALSGIFASFCTGYTFFSVCLPSNRVFLLTFPSANSYIRHPRGFYVANTWTTFSRVSATCVIQENSIYLSLYWRW